MLLFTDATSKPDGLSALCFFSYNDEHFCGLAKNDCVTVDTPEKDWQLASGSALASNRKAMKTLRSSNSSASRMLKSVGERGSEPNAILMQFEGFHMLPWAGQSKGLQVSCLLFGAWLLLLLTTALSFFWQPITNSGTQREPNPTCELSK